MANNVFEGIIYVDTASDIISSSRRIKITGIQILASNAIWAITLTNSAGDIIFAASNVVGIQGTISKSFPTTGLICTVLTNCTANIYTEN